MSLKKHTKYIIITGGVLSGLGKGVTTAAIGKILSVSKKKVVPIKCDGYLNTDPGTMNPIQHGEVYVLDDGGEVDMDFGHYERFINTKAKKDWNLTMGKVFLKILEKERKGDYLGETVQYIPHVVNLIKSIFYEIPKKEKADIALIEIGGTIGDIENELYVEATRQLKYEIGQENILFAHLTYIPIPYGVGEAKTKPTQQSVKLLNEKGIRPDVIICRCAEYLSENIKEKIALYCNIKKNAVISNIDVSSVYQLPVIFQKEGLNDLISKKLDIKLASDFGKWPLLVRNLQSKKEKSICIALCGKYTALQDSYASIVEALKHCEAHLKVEINIKFIETTAIDNLNKPNSKFPSKNKLKMQKFYQSLVDISGIIIPGGFGVRGAEGKINIIEYARKNDIPFLGICYGMHLGIVEFARNVCGLKGANTTEIETDNIKVMHPVIDILPEQKNIKNMGATMRLGGQNVLLKENTLAGKLYKKPMIRKRFRHRWEVNPYYVKKLENCGMVFSGISFDNNIMQMAELPSHSYYIMCQYHPELDSRLEKPEPLFLGLTKAAIKFSNKIKK